MRGISSARLGLTADRGFADILQRVLHVRVRGVFAQRGHLRRRGAGEPDAVRLAAVGRKRMRAPVAHQGGSLGVGAAGEGGFYAERVT